MWGRRALYALALLGALLGQILDIGYLFHYLFILTLALPLLGLAVSLPAMLGCRERLTVSAPQIVRGGDALWRLTIRNRVPLPVGRVKGRLRSRNPMTGETVRYRFSVRGAVSGVGETWEADTERCGLLDFRVESLWVCDCLGLFSLPVRRDGAVSLLVRPVSAEPGALDLPEGTGQPRPVPRGRSVSGEDYELRPYREGDSLRLVHWKQSAKRDELVTREVLEDRRPLVMLTFDHFGAPEEMERTLDRLEGHAQALLDRERPFEVRWAHPETGAVRRFSVENQRDYLRCLTAALSDPAPEQGRSVLETPLAADRDAVLHHIHITGEETRRGTFS